LRRDYRGEGNERLDRYAGTALRRVWRCQHFSWWMTTLLHAYPGEDAFPAPAPARAARLRHALAGGGNRVWPRITVGLPWEWTEDGTR
jgi:p-hydroxybenzoate 3-monooxygenase